MDLLQVNGSQVITANGQPIDLRGVCIGGWMNMEEFINGYPGSEHGARASMTRKLGAETAQFFFDRMLDYVFAEDDVIYLKSLGSTVVRLPLNYRHFETDMKPFEYLESGFARLDQALGWCEKHGVYVILDMHAVPGWQNTDWHSDNSTRHTFFWQQVHFQDRFVALWEEFARRYRGRAVIAGYNVMNEPVTNTPYGRFSPHYEPDWELINRIYHRVTTAIRAIDPDHIIFLEGDYYSTQFDGFEPPFAPNLVYSSHNYNTGGFGPGPYPGLIRGEQWDYQKQEQIFLAHSGTRFTQKHNVPLWVGEFGAAYNGPAHEIPDRLRALNDQLTIFNKYGAHWTMWTYKDIHVMGWVQLAPEAPYVQAIRHILDAKRELATDFWMGWIAPTAAKEKVFELADLIEKTLEDETIDTKANRTYLAQAALSGYTAGLMQPLYARSFEGMNQTQLDQVLQSFTLKQCHPHFALIDVIRKHL
jgi:aryl-phospho-beta-D-glucosidase BglC (GH1 family)